MSILEKFNKKQVEAATEGKDIPDFQAGDTVRINVRIIEGDKERIQAFEGVCIARRNRGINSSFTVRKVSSGEGVERVFPLYSPRLESIKLVRRGDVRRAKLYYMRKLSGRAARIKEKRDFDKPAAEVQKIEPASKADKAESPGQAKEETPKKAAGE